MFNIGGKKLDKMVNVKNKEPVKTIILGVTNAVNLYLNFWKIVHPNNIITNVIVPLHVEKFPKNTE